MRAPSFPRLEGLHEETGEVGTEVEVGDLRALFWLVTFLLKGGWLMALARAERLMRRSIYDVWWIRP